MTDRASRDCIRECDSLRAEVERADYATRRAREEVERLRALLSRAESFMSNVPTDEQLDARMKSGDCGRDVWGDIHDELKGKP